MASRSLTPSPSLFNSFCSQYFPLVNYGKEGASGDTSTPTCAVILSRTVGTGRESKGLGDVAIAPRELPIYFGSEVYRLIPLTSSLE